MEKILNILKRSKIENDEKSQNESLQEKYSIRRKREEFFKWAEETDITTYVGSQEFILNFINKMAIWYELRFPNSEIDNIFNEKDKGESILEITNKSEGMNDLLYFSLDDSTKDNLANTLWSDLLDTKTFLNTLSYNEKELLVKPKYPSSVTDYNVNLSVDLTANGKITYIHGRNQSTGLSGQEIFGFKNKNIEELLNYLKENEIKTCEFLETVDWYKKRVLFKEKLLDNVLYRIIELGGAYYGVKRGYLFAREFKRDLDIPLTYYTPLYESNRVLLNDYLKNGGNKNLVCASGYFINNENIEEVSLSDWYNLKSIRKTQEELEMYKKIVTILKNEVSRNSFELEKHQQEKDREEIQQKRLERKLEKSKNR